MYDFGTAMDCSQIQAYSDRVTAAKVKHSEALCDRMSQTEYCEVEYQRITRGNLSFVACIEDLRSRKESERVCSDQCSALLQIFVAQLGCCLWSADVIHDFKPLQACGAIRPALATMAQCPKPYGKPFVRDLVLNVVWTTLEADLNSNSSRRKGEFADALIRSLQDDLKADVGFPYDAFVGSKFSEYPTSLVELEEGVKVPGTKFTFWYKTSSDDFSRRLGKSYDSKAAAGLKFFKTEQFLRSTCGSSCFTSPVAQTMVLHFPVYSAATSVAPIMSLVISILVALWAVVPL